MLVLSRHRDEVIMIGDDIEITIVDIKGDKVRIGINAPRDIQVHRKEVYLAIKKEPETTSAAEVPGTEGTTQEQVVVKKPKPERKKGKAKDGSLGLPPWSEGAAPA